MKSINEFFGKPASKISKPLKQKFNIYSKYENRMTPKDFETLGKKLFNRELKGSPQSLAQGLSPDSIGNVKSRYGEKFSIKANSKPEATSYTTKLSNWTRLPDFPQSQGQHHRYYVNPTEKKILVNYRNEGRKPSYYLYDAKKPTIEALRQRTFKSLTRTNEDFEKTKDINTWFYKSVRDVNSPGRQIKNSSNWVSKIKLDSGKNIKASYFTQRSVAKRNMNILKNNEK